MGEARHRTVQGYWRPPAQDVVRADTALISNQVSTRFRADHSTLSFGPTLQRPLADSWTLEAGIGVSLHWLHWSARQKETLSATNSAGGTVVASWSDRASGNKILAGIYLQVGTEWTPEDQNWSIKTLLRTDLGGKFSKQIGPSRVSYEVDGLTAAVLFSHKL